MARTRGRVRFAAPLVIVVGCGHPQEHPTPPSPSPADASTAQSIDAAALADARSPVVCVEHCNPPPPRVIDSGKIVATKTVDGQLVLDIVLEGGDDPHQVTTRWTAVLTLAGRPIPRGELTVLSASGHSIRASLATPIDRLEQYRVRFTPP